MNTQMRKALLGLASVAAFAVAGAAQAANVSYEGETILYSSDLGTSIQCTLQVSGTIDSSGNVQINSAGARTATSSDSPLCALVYTGDLPWTGSTSSSTITTSAGSTLIYDPSSGSVLASCGTGTGDVDGVSYGAGSPPATVTISSGSGTPPNYGNCNLDTVTTLNLLP